MMSDRRDVVPEKEEHITEVHILAIDLAKRSFQTCATALGRAVLFDRTVSLTKFESVLREQPPCVVAMEACATSLF
jgi:transposase